VQLVDDAEHDVIRRVALGLVRRKGKTVAFGYFVLKKNERRKLFTGALLCV
jgi:hypothetical protein